MQLRWGDCTAKLLVLVLGNILADICIVLSAVSGITISSFAVVSSIRAIACIGVIHDFSTVRRQYRITLAVGCHAAIRHRGIRRGGVGFGGIRGAGAVGSLGLNKIVVPPFVWMEYDMRESRHLYAQVGSSPLLFGTTMEVGGSVR